MTARAWLAALALRIAGPIVATWVCDRPGCGAVNSDSTSTCYRCGG